MADLVVHLAESRASRGVPEVLPGVARGDEVLGEGEAHLGWRARVAESDC